MNAKDVVEIREIVDLLDDAVYTNDFGHLEDYGPVKHLIAVAIEAADRLETLVQGRGYG